jgi:tyrosyl-DNA phosphodiesterase-1
MNYGVHHTKMFLTGFSDGTLRVIIHTANLRYSDIHLKAQAAYIQDFSLKQNPYVGYCEFEKDLLSYIESYQYHTSQAWDGQSRTLAQELRRYDFSSARAVLIPSIPGRHSLTRPPHWTFETQQGHSRTHGDNGWYASSRSLPVFIHWINILQVGRKRFP